MYEPIDRASPYVSAISHRHIRRQVVRIPVPAGNAESSIASEVHRASRLSVRAPPTHLPRYRILRLSSEVQTEVNKTHDQRLEVEERKRDYCR